ncbi:MAG: hypothetical protein DMF93_04615 [Acidobacteria bacterium]|nr:MAG: hypothetical protein DMF93_04615 [Acidobacteriota bacterium]
MAAARARSSASSPIASAIAPADCSTHRPQPSISTTRHGHVRVVTTGTPAASDSTTARPKLSESEHWTETSASLSSAHFSAPSTAPIA